MATLYITNDGAYVWSKDKSITTHQSAVEAMAVGIEKFKLEPKEFMFALSIMNKEFHNCAQFGIMGTFMYSEKIELNKVWGADVTFE